MKDEKQLKIDNHNNYYFSTVFVSRFQVSILWGDSPPSASVC